MNALDCKLWRNLGQMKSQALAIALVMMCGVGTYIMFLSTLVPPPANPPSKEIDGFFRLARREEAA